MAENSVRTTPGEALGKALGFIPSLYWGWVEVVEPENAGHPERLYLGYVSSKNPHQGNVTRLIQYWMALGFDVRIIKPVDKTKRIIKRLGFIEDWEPLPEHYPHDDLVEVWRTKTTLEGVEWPNSP